MARLATRYLNAFETLLRHERTLLAVLLATVIASSWAWIIAMARDMYGPMTGPSAWMMTSRWDAAHLLLLWAMWAVMMAGMMLPSASPLLLLYMRSGRARDDDNRVLLRACALATGYLLVWAAFSVGATSLQWILASRTLLTPMMEPALPAVGATLLLLAGLYQLTPLKRACLQACRSPLSFLMGNWRPGLQGALQMGIAHGAYCLGCCWALMLLLFAGGVMNLAVIAALTAWVMVEKLFPYGKQGAYASGALLIATGLWMLLR